MDRFSILARRQYLFSPGVALVFFITGSCSPSVSFNYKKLRPSCHHLSLHQMVREGESNTHSLGIFLEIKAGSQVKSALYLSHDPCLAQTLVAKILAPPPCCLAFWVIGILWHLTYCNHRACTEATPSHLLNFPFHSRVLALVSFSLTHTCRLNSQPTTFVQQRIIIKQTLKTECLGLNPCSATISCVIVKKFFNHSVTQFLHL